MAINKVVYGNNTLIDITDTTAVASDVATNKVFYTADGTRTTGTASGGGSSVDWTDVGYTGTPSVISNYETLAHDRALSVKQQFEVWSPRHTGSNDRLQQFGYTLTEPNSDEVICFPDLTLGTKADKWSYAFTGYSKLVYIPKTLLVATENTSSSMTQMFNGCRSLEEVDLSNLNTSNVTNMNQMFANCETLKTITGLTSFNTAKVTNFSYMFSNCTSFKTLNVSSFNTKKGTNFSSMFYGCTELTHIDFGDNFSLVGITGGNTNVSNMFTSIAKLDDTTLNKILAILPTATRFTGTKTLKQFGFTSTTVPASKWQSLSNYSTFTSAGWTIGY